MKTALIWIVAGATVVGLVLTQPGIAAEDWYVVPSMALTATVVILLFL